MAKLAPAEASETSSKEPYCPDSCDIVWMHFDPHLGREQAGHRMAYVLSPRKYNQASGLCLVCPITTQVKGYPWEVLLPDEYRAHGVILADQVKSLSWYARKSEFVTACPVISEEVIRKIEALLPM